MGRFTGRHEHKVDAKGRVSVPSSFRAVLVQQNAGSIFLRFDEEKGAIEGFSEAFMDDVAEAIEALDMHSEDRDAMEEEYFGKSVELTMDRDGRIILPREMAEQAGITDTAAFVGLLKRFEIWEPAAHTAERARRTDIARKIPLKKAPRP